MSAKLACMAGGPLCSVLESGQLSGKQLPRQETPFGTSEQILLVEDSPAPFYLVPWQQPGRRRQAPSYINHRATLYALKDLGAEAVLSWSAAGAISHNYPPGQVVIPDDAIDMTTRRATTFFEKSGLGLLRQFPVFCPALRTAAEHVLGQLQIAVHAGGTVAVTEGPRLETPAEVRVLAGMGAELVTHSLVPEVFLAKELQMCFAGACYVVNYAETGSRHRPFSTGDLFGGLTRVSDAERLRRPTQALPQLLGQLAQLCADTQPSCQCRQTMAGCIADEGLDDDWHKWFE